MLSNRFWLRVDTSAGPDACWPWTQGRSDFGYGRVSHVGKPQSTHRLALMEKVGRSLSPQEQACHTCDNPPCCNPRHLFVGNAAINKRDSISKGRAYGSFKQVKQESGIEVQVSLAREESVIREIRENPSEHVTFTGTPYRPDGGILISRAGRRVLLHRWLWQQLVGPISRNDFMIRDCDKMGCQNPYHFVKSTSPHGDPVRAAPNPPPSAVAEPEIPLCPQGHPLTDDNVYESTDSKGHHHRKCRECGILRAREQRARAKQRRNEQAIFQGAES